MKEKRERLHPKATSTTAYHQGHNWRLPNFWMMGGEEEKDAPPLRRCKRRKSHWRPIIWWIAVLIGTESVQQASMMTFAGRAFTEQSGQQYNREHMQGEQRVRTGGGRTQDGMDNGEEEQGLSKFQLQQQMLISEMS